MRKDRGGTVVALSTAVPVLAGRVPPASRVLPTGSGPRAVDCGGCSISVPALPTGGADPQSRLDESRVPEEPPHSCSQARPSRRLAAQASSGTRFGRRRLEGRGGGGHPGGREPHPPRPQRKSLWQSIAKSALLLPLVLTVAACRGDLSTEPPVHLNPHMDTLPRYDPQEGNPMFADGRAMRPLVPGTVARGHLRDDPHRFRGLVDGQPATTLPMPVTKALLERGEERYQIFCAPCHDGAGYGNGLVAQRGFQPPPSNLHDKRLREKPVGHFYQVITDGIRNMPSHAAQIPVDDRWAIAAYVRALQLSQHATIDDVPEDVRASKGWTQ